MDDVRQGGDGTTAPPLMARIAVATHEPTAATEAREVVFDMHDVCVYYGETLALAGVNMEIYKNTITAMIGPSGCGKSTFVRSLNRMNDSIPGSASPARRSTTATTSMARASTRSKSAAASAWSSSSPTRSRSRSSTTSRGRRGSSA